MKHAIICASMVALSSMAPAAVLAASDNSSALASLRAVLTAQTATLGPEWTGQPNQSCESTPNTPGKAAGAPGSAFNPDGKAGTVYAGEQPQNSRNSASVSQYDVACFEQPVF